MTPETLLADPYALFAGLLVMLIVEGLKRWPAIAFLKPESAKFKKALTALILSVATRLVPAVIAWAQAGTVPDWPSIGRLAWQAFLTFVVASGAWAVLVHRSASAKTKPEAV